MQHPPALAEIAAERDRQRADLGYTPEHDDEHDAGQLAQAAACYALDSVPTGTGDGVRAFWPFDDVQLKHRSQRQSLVVAGALILAEIERLDRRTAALHGKPRESVPAPISDAQLLQWLSAESFLIRSLTEDARATAYPLDLEVSVWRAEARQLRAMFRDRFAPWMAPHVSMAKAWAFALAGVPDKLGGLEPLLLPEVCPITLDDMLAEDPAG